MSNFDCKEKKIIAMYFCRCAVSENPVDLAINHV